YSGCYGVTKNSQDEYMLILQWYSSKCKGCYGEKSSQWLHFCQPCQTRFFQSNFDKWSSENADIDETIRKFQLNAKGPAEVIEWIHFSAFSDIQKIIQGGFCSVDK